MPSERVQRQIDRLLDEAEAASEALDWATVQARAEHALTFDPDNDDARALLEAARRGLSAAPTLEATPPTEAPRASSAQPTSFAAGRYEVRRFLGEGGKKRVFLAHDTRLDRDVAFALIKTDGLDEVGRERVTREAQAMGRLGAHPHLVSIYDIGEEAGAPYVVTELLGGGDVEGLLAAEGGPLPLGRTLEIAKDVCRGLAFAHTQGVVHRDLKPGNVWLTSEGVAKIGDFGLAVAPDRSRLTTHGLMVGTVAYMPPEQALGGEVTPQADLYSLGAMLYELVTGKPPFAGDNPTAIISQHINTPPVAPSWHSEHCPPDLEALILHLLAKVPADRPSSATEVLEALERVDPEGRSASHSDSSANPLDRLARGVFVGRERELERLRAAFDEAFAGRGCVVMLVGEPGIGKTRTVQELTTYARMRGAKVAWGRAHEASGAPAYWPWVQVGRDYASQTESEALTRQLRDHALELQRLFPGIKERFPGLPEPPPADSEEAQFILFDAFSAFFRAASADAPVVLVLDDLHWADRPTLRLLTHLAREIAHARLLVVGTYRDTDLDRQHPLSQALAELNREALFTRVPLRGLTLEETAAYIGATAGSEPAPALVRRVHEETEGNPFFLSEVVRLMTEEGTLSRDSVSDIAIPEGVKEALGRRLDRLSPEANELLSVAAVVGRECTHALLAALVDFDDDALLRLVEEALAARVLEETGTPGEYRFTHALMQDALYSELSTARRVRMHGRVAETLESLHAAELDRHASELARHFAEAAVMNRSLAEKAVRYAELAAQQAEAVAGWDEAARWYREAIDGLSTYAVGSVREGNLWISLWSCLFQIDNRGVEAWSAFQRGAAVLRATGDPEAFAEGVARVGARGSIGTAEAIALQPLLEQALAALQGKSSTTAVRLLAFLARADYYSAPGDAYAERARQVFETLSIDDPELTSLLRSDEQIRTLQTGDFARSAAIGEEAASALLAFGDRAPLEHVAVHLGQAALSLMSGGEVDRARALAERALGFARELRSHRQMANNEVRLAEIHFHRGDRAAFDSLMEAHPRAFGMMRLRAVDAILRGDRRSIEALLVPSAWDPPPGDLSLPPLRARLLLHDGQLDAARATFADWSHELDIARYPNQRGLASGVALAEETLTAFGTPVLLEWVYELLMGAPVRTMRVSISAGTPVDVVRGQLALRLERPLDEAEAHFRTGLEWARRPDVRFGLVEGRCLQGLAEVAEARGDHSMAMQHLDAAAALFAKHGAKLYLNQVLAKKSVLGA